MRALVCVVILLLTSLPNSAQAQRNYWEKSTNKDASIGSIDNPQSSTYVDINERINGTECEALRKSSREGGRYVADIVRTDQNLQSTASMICPCAPKPGLWLERIVFCFASAPDGLVYNIMQDLILGVKDYYLAIYGPLIAFAIALFGWKMTTGQLQSLPKDTALFALKVGGVLTFLTMFPIIHGLLLRIVQDLTELVSTALNGFSDICNFGPGVKKPNLWAQWDCMFGKLVGVSVADPTGKVVGSGLFVGFWAYLLAFLFLPFPGLIIATAGIAAIFKLIAAALRAVNTYFMAIIAISFMMLLAPLFVPLILFGVSLSRFETWLQILIGYVLQPMILMLFMGIMTVALQYSIFQGPASLFGTTTNTPATSAQHFGKLMYEGAGNGVDLSKHFREQEILKGAIGVNPEKMLAKPGQNNSLKYGEKMGDVGIMKNVPLAPSNVPTGPDSMEGGVNVFSVDVNGLVDGLNKRNGAVTKLDPLEYLKNIALQCLTTVMLVYTMFTMLGHIPDLAHGLVSSGSANLASAKIVGQDQAGRAMAIGKAIIRAKLGDTSAVKDIVQQAGRNLEGR